MEVELRKNCTTPACESDFCEKKVPSCMVGALLEVELRKICATPARAIDLEVKIIVVFAWQAQGLRRVAKYVAGAGVREGCENVGRRGGFGEGLKRCFSRGRRRDLALCDVDV